jgi:hypothetical protein
VSPPSDEYPDAPNGADTKKEGEDYQEFVRKLLNPWGITIWNWKDKKQQFAFGENPQGFEIKLDMRCTETDRLSIEVQEKTRRNNRDWINSGILRNDNSWIYVQGNYQIIFVFAKNWLRRFYDAKVTPADIHESHGTVRKFYLPMKTARMMAALVIDGDGRRVWQ